MQPNPERWTLDGFLNHFQAVHETMPDYQFGWIIGAGASKSSGIPTGGELVEWWLEDMHLRECRTDQKIEKWATGETLGIEKFKYVEAAASYPRIYERRFKDFPEEGFAFLEHVMTGNSKRRSDQGLVEARPTRVIEPGPGYSILAKIMETQRHRVVITTNFDNLLADALQVYTSTYPFVCGHESLTGFVRVAMRRPVICKIHRDLLLAPFNDTRKLRLLHEAWSATLRSLLGQYTPVVIGYGGNDDSLMERLNSLERDEIKGRLIWCYYEGHDKKSEPSQRIQALVSELNGVLVPVPDFDRLMILLGARLGVEVLDQDLEVRQNARTKRYRDSVLAMKTDDLPQLKAALIKTYQRAGWWWWQLKVDECIDPDAMEDAYRDAVKNCPQSPQLFGNFAVFMTDVRKKHDEAESLYRRALELDPNQLNSTGNFANFMTDVRRNYDEAEKLYRRALELDPNQPDNTSNFAIFMSDVRKNYDEAEKLFRRSLELNPDNANSMGNFAGFLIIRGRIDEAASVIHRALELNHDQPTQLLAEVLIYQCVLNTIRKTNFKTSLARLKRLLLMGFDRFPWSFDALFKSIKAKIPGEDLAVIKAYAAAVLDADKLAGLDQEVKQIRKQNPVDVVNPAVSLKNKKQRIRKTRDLT